MSTKNFFASFAMLNRQLLIRGKILSPVEFSGALSFSLHLFANAPRYVSSPCIHRQPTIPNDTYGHQFADNFPSGPCPAKNSPFLHFPHGPPLLPSHALTLSRS